MTEDELIKRRQKYRELFQRIPGKKTSERITWLVENLHCSRITACIWNMKDSKRPIPAAKLAIIEAILERVAA